MAAGSTERTSGYFGDQTPNESKKPSFPSRIRFYHFWRGQYQIAAAVKS
jgi:hypothetical protein